LTWFKVLIRGENLPVALEGKRANIGFFVIRFIAAADMACAEEQARNTVATEVGDSVPTLGVGAIMELLEIDEIEPVDEKAVPATPQDYAFFAMEQ
jgi:hypothetical protein